ncbi:MAG TPA: VOC family protein [Bacteroidia bacterium]|nr:VOC family protein [Bacteroidia bacterium]HNS11901.1 VOC family protein [Bacteroidia bacterium]
MENLVSWFEIPVKNFGRACDFYKGILACEIKEAEMFGTKMGFLPSDGKNVSGALVQGEDYSPSTQGVTLYLNGGEDLKTILDKVEANKGKVLVPKTQISPEMGYFAMFLDTEGNKLALHSKG